MKIHIPGRGRVSPVGNSGGSGLVSSPSGLAGRPRQPGMNREASVSPSGHLSRAAAWIPAAAAEVAMVMDRCKRRRNRLKSALGRRRVSQSEDLLRCRFSLSRTASARLQMDKLDPVCVSAYACARLATCICGGDSLSAAAPTRHRFAYQSGSVSIINYQLHTKRLGEGRSSLLSLRRWVVVWSFSFSHSTAEIPDRKSIGFLVGRSSWTHFSRLFWQRLILQLHMRGTE